MGFSNRIISNRSLIKDLAGVLLALTIGIGGQIFISDPLGVLVSASKLPILSPQDWPGSWVTTELWISGTEPWKEKRQFVQVLSIENDMHNNSHIDHTIVWYADPSEAAAFWNQPNPYSDVWQEIAARNPEDGKPASRLLCVRKETPNSPQACKYLAYWEHWYTEVDFWSQFDEDLQPLEIQQITTRVDQLLMSAPAEPCKGIFCTGELRNDGR